MPGAARQHIAGTYNTTNCQLGITNAFDGQSNNELTLCSACVYRIALLSSSPTDRTVSLSNRFSGGVRMVSVMTTSLIGASVMRCTAGPLSRPWVAHTYTSFAP